MPDINAARSQMAMSLAFHVIFSYVGIAMPLLMVTAEWLHQRTGDARDGSADSPAVVSVPAEGLQEPSKTCAPTHRCRKVDGRS
jgi:Cytochrome bd terminal oxidase subunit I